MISIVSTWSRIFSTACHVVSNHQNDVTTIIIKILLFYYKILKYWYFFLVQLYIFVYHRYIDQYQLYAIMYSTFYLSQIKLKCAYKKGPLIIKRSWSPVRDSKSFDTSINRQNIGHMSIIKPKSWCVYQHSPIVGVTTFEKLFWIYLEI